MSISSLCRSGTPSASDGVLERPAGADVSPLPRLLYIASTKSQGGIERHSVEMAAALAGRGASVRFACAPGSFIEAWCRDAGLPVLPLRVRNSGDLGAAWRLAKLIQSECIELVHAHSRRDYVVAVLGVALARRVLRCPAALVLHAHMIRSLGDPAKLSDRFFSRGANAVVAVSAAVRDFLLAEDKFPPPFIRLIPNAVDLEQFARPGSTEAARRRTAARQSLGVPGGAVVLGIIGRLDAKGQRQLLSAVPALREAYSTLRPDLWVVCVGSEGKPGEQAALTAQANAGGFAERLVFTGPRFDIPFLLPALDVLVHLPLDEAFGLALAEAMAAGLPTIATAIGGCREVVQDEVTGLLVPPGDRAALVRALRRLLDPVQGPELRAALGRCGCQVVQERFSQTVQLERLESLYRELFPTVIV